MLYHEGFAVHPLVLWSHDSGVGFFGGINNTCKTYGEDLQHDAPSFGFQVPEGVRNLDEAVENLPKDRPVLLITSSYVGQPPDHAKGFVAWLETRAAAGDDSLLSNAAAVLHLLVAPSLPAYAERRLLPEASFRGG